MKIKIITLLSILLLITFVLPGPALTSTSSIDFVDTTVHNTAGTSIITANITDTSYDGEHVNTAGAPWENAWNHATTVVDVTTVYVGTTISKPNYWCRTSYFRFDFSEIIALYEAGKEITSIKLKLYCESKDSTGVPGFYFLAKTNGGLNGWYSYADYPYSKISQVVSYASIITEDYLYFEIQDPNYSDLSYIWDDADGIVYFQLIDQSQFYGFQPLEEWSSSKYTYITFADSSTAGTEYDPQIICEYSDVALPRETVARTPGPEYTGGLTGTENVTSIEWDSPRALFSDETARICFVGDPGATVNATMQTSSGTIIDSITDTIKTDGYCPWNVSFSPSLNDWIIVSQYNGVSSTWGRVEPIPDNDNSLNTVNSLVNKNKQYDTKFSNYIIYDDEICKIFWKTNLETTDFTDYSLYLLAGGNNISYNATMQYINDNIFHTFNSDNDFLTQWRYIFFRINDSGTSDSKDGFIINFLKPYVYNSTGFQMPSIRSSSDNLTTTESSYFYLSPSDKGITISLPKTIYNTLEDIPVSIDVGLLSKVSQYLSNVTISIIDSTGNTVKSESTFVSVDKNTRTIKAPLTRGSYTLRLSFFDNTNTPEFTYTYQIPLSINPGSGITPPGTSPNDVWKLFEDFLDSQGWLTDIGKAIIVFIAMIATYYFTRKRKILSVIFPLIIFGIAIISNWIPMWVVALLALSVGLTAYQLLRKKAQGQTNND